jgi:SPX domain protein involved in polyphosphate accumulation
MALNTARPASKDSLQSGRPGEKSPASATSGRHRHERKFLIADLTEQEVRSIVRLHPALFREIYKQRWVNNIYFDSPFLHSYHDNVNGSPDRVKTRVRWYGELFGRVEKPVLELKIKRGAVGRKELYAMPPFVFGTDFSSGKMLDGLEKSDLPDDVRLKLRSLSPALVNRYLRSYYVSADGIFRVTIDTKQLFLRVHSGPNLFLHRRADDVSVILELKYDCDADTDAETITGRFPFRLTRSSKYVAGVSSVHA